MIAPPGKRWAYSSPTTQLLARIIRDAVGGPEQTLAFAWRELFNPLGMRNVTLEFDGAGTLQGSTYMLASAGTGRKFGLLYLNDGDDRRQSHPAGGLGGFLGRRHARHRLRRRLLDQPQRAPERQRAASGSAFPRDAFFASGDLGQRIVIMPSQHLVVVRLGDCVDPTGDIRGLGRLVKEVIAATQP